ncbi:thermonuclease family protein [Rhodospirillaceae bacterium SYSU D60014]|uniref:thermonuclease family protein n=1 Tax=Virgifigura deserti TaxID=2268457 RepID=UPI0013C474DB
MIRLALLFCLLAGPALAQSLTVPAEVTRIVDADTLDVLATPWPGMTIAARVRLLDVNAPETYRPQCEAERDLARLATAFVRSRIGDRVWLADVQPERDSFGRVLARVVTSEGDLGNALLNAGLARPERRGYEEGWCD